MSEYLVSWSADITADDPKQAAQEAMAILRSQLGDAGLAPIFEVDGDDEPLVSVEVTADGKATVVS